ncbi:MAG: PEGA domain-containing protein [Parcubacteria group bacterium]|nr:PEGA domain-containing protein [Parcubacteria group bacterium]
MTLKTRRVLYISFMALFFFAAPPLVLYTAGFRYDFEYRRVVETGSLVVKSEPPGAAVYLNGELYRDATPTIINTILPGKIKLLVEKEGYHPWEKEVEIQPRITAFEEAVTLFAKASPEAVVQGKVAQYWWNRSYDLLAYTTPDGTLRLFNRLNQKDTLIANVSNPSRVALSWSPSSDAFFFSRSSRSGREEFILLDTRSLERIVPIADVAASPLHNLQWDPVTQTALYGLTQTGSLLRVNYLLRTERVVYEGPVKSYLVLPQRIVMIESNASGDPSLSWINPADQTTVHLLPDVPVREDDELLPASSPYIAVRNPRTNTLSVINPTALPPLSGRAVTTIGNVAEARWARDGSMLVYSDGFGIYTRLFTAPIPVLPERKETSALVTRYSTPVRELAVDALASHAFYAVRGELRSSELTSSSDPRSTSLRSGVDEISGLRYVRRRNSLTFINQDKTLLELPLSREDARAFPFGD